MAPPSQKNDERQVVKLLGCDRDQGEVTDPTPCRDLYSSRVESGSGLGRVLMAMSGIGNRVKHRSARRCNLTEDGCSGRSSNEKLMCLMEDNPFILLKEAARGDLEAFRKSYTADPSRLKVQNDKGQTALHVASVNGHVDIVHFILEHDADLNLVDNQGDTALHSAVRHDQPQVVDILLQKGADHSLTNDQKMAPLHLACDLGYVDVVKVLARNPDVDKNQPGENGYRPLHYCSFKDHAECASVLLEYGARPCLMCDQGNFPIHIAAKCASTRTMEVLIQEAFKLGYTPSQVLSFRDKANNMPLHAAVIGGNIQAVEVCLRAGAPVNTQQDDKSTPVHFAAAQGNLAMMQLMCTWQSENFLAALSIRDAMSMTPLHRAALFNHKAMVLYLLEKGADINSVDNRGCTPLLVAAEKGCWDTVQSLMESGADVQVRNQHARNFLHLAIRFGGKLEQFFLKQTTIMVQQQQQQQESSPKDMPDNTSPEASANKPPQPLKRRQTSSSMVPVAKLASSISPSHSSHSIQDIQILLDEKDEFGCTPLHYASKAGHLLAIEELIKLGATPSLKNNNKQSPFHFACRYGRYNTCRRLLDLAQGPNIMNETDSEGLTGLHIAAQNGHTKIISLLLERGAVIHRDNADNTPLHHAAAQGWTQSMRILLAIHNNLLNIKNLNGETALHVAANEGQVRAVTLLLTLGASLVRDNANKTFIDYVIEHKLCEVALAVVKHDRWEEVLRSPSGPYRYPFLGLIEHMPLVCEAVLDRCQVSSKHDKNSAEHYIEYNFRFLNCPAECIEKAKKDGSFNPLMTFNAMVKHGSVNCLSHPVCVRCLRLKWSTYGIWFYVIVLGLYLLFLASLTIIVCNTDSLRHFDSGDVDNNTVIMLSGNNKRYDHIPALSKVCLWVIAVFSVLSMVKEVLQMITQGLRYLVEFQNFVEWSLYGTSLLFSAPFIMGFSHHWQWEAGACAIFLAWFSLLVMLQRFDFFGIYVVMFLEILRTLVQALCVFSVLIVAFGLAFHILLNHEITNAYSTPGLSILRAAMMMLELDYMASFNDPYTDSDTTTLHFGSLTMAMVVLFVLLMPILLINLLIGLAVGDIEAVQRNARLKRLAGQVQMHTDMERKMPLFLLSRLSYCVYRYYPNRCSKSIISVWKRMTLSDKEDYTGVVEAKQAAETLLELVKQKQKLKDMGSTLEKNNQLLRLIMQKMEIQTEDDAWDEGLRMDRGNISICLPTLTDTAEKAAGSRQGHQTAGRHVMQQSSIVHYMKKNAHVK